MAKLVLSLNNTVVNQYFTDKDVIRIGRDNNNDIVVNDALLSREHARITCIGEDHIIEDLQSGNGTQVNGNPVQQKILRHRDVIGLGNHVLRYLNTRMAAEADLERTMLIKPLLRPEQPMGESIPTTVAAIRPSRSWQPEANIKILVSGSNKHAPGNRVRLDRVVTTFGTPGQRLIVITRRPQGYFLTHVEGSHPPKLNHRAIMPNPHLLRHGDEIEAAGYRLVFRINEAS